MKTSLSATNQPLGQLRCNPSPVATRPKRRRSLRPGEGAAATSPWLQWSLAWLKVVLASASWSHGG